MANLDQVDEWVRKITARDRTVLARAITLIESSRKEDRDQAKTLIRTLRKLAKPKLRLAVTGPPGVGKSSMIEKLGMFLIQEGWKVAVLSIDPSSQIKGGSILGDKTRMQDLSKQENAFVRPSPSGQYYGGTSRYTRDIVLLLEAAGYDIIAIETVGVGQSEVGVFQMTDLGLILLQPGSGDELQSIKKGILEWADLFVITKADGATERLAQKAYSDMVHSFPPSVDGATLAKKVLLYSTEKEELTEVLAKYICASWEQIQHSGQLTQKRLFQEANDFILHWHEELKDVLLANKDIVNQLNTIKDGILDGSIDREEAFNLMIRFTFALCKKQ